MNAINNAKAAYKIARVEIGIQVGISYIPVSSLRARTSGRPARLTLRAAAV
jgi:hypothetical protein